MSTWEYTPRQTQTQTCWRDYISHLAWERLRISLEELEEVSGGRMSGIVCLACDLDPDKRQHFMLCLLMLLKLNCCYFFSFPLLFFLLLNTVKLYQCFLYLEL